MNNKSELAFYKGVMQRTYGVLGWGEGEMQNERDINAWEKSSITAEQAAELRKYNKELKKALIAIQNS